MNVIIYTRVSTSKQADLGVSLDVQLAKCRQFASLFDLDVVDEISDEGISAKTMDRPGLTLALDAINQGTADGLLVMKLDRLTRSLRDASIMIQDIFCPGGANLFSVSEKIDTTTAMGRMQLNMIILISQWERETIGERTSASMQHMKANNRRVGGLPFGFDDVDGHLVPNAQEQQAIGTIKALHKANMSLRGICREMGDHPRSQKPWQPQQIKRIVQN